jgi:gas vesicle protein
MNKLNNINGRLFVNGPIRCTQQLTVDHTIYSKKIKTTDINQINVNPIIIGPNVKIKNLIVENLSAINANIKYELNETHNKELNELNELRDNLNNKAININELKDKLTKNINELRDNLNNKAINISELKNELSDKTTDNINKLRDEINDNVNKLRDEINDNVNKLRDEITGGINKSKLNIDEDYNKQNNKVTIINGIAIDKSELICGGLYSKLGIITPYIVGTNNGVEIEGILFKNGQISFQNETSINKSQLNVTSLIDNKDNQYIIKYKWIDNKSNNTIIIQFDEIQIKKQCETLLCGTLNINPYPIFDITTPIFANNIICKCSLSINGDLTIYMKELLTFPVTINGFSIYYHYTQLKNKMNK